MTPANRVRISQFDPSDTYDQKLLLTSALSEMTGVADVDIYRAHTISQTKSRVADSQIVNSGLGCSLSCQFVNAYQIGLGICGMIQMLPSYR